MDIEDLFNLVSNSNLANVKDQRKLDMSVDNLQLMTVV